MTEANKEVPVISLGGKIGEVIVKVNGAEIHVSADGGIKTKPAANDTAIAAAKAAIELGAKMADGSVFAGLTADGKHQIYAMPADLDVTMTFNDAAKAVKNLNSNKVLGHDDWQIPSLENLRILQKNQNEGALKGTFKTAARSIDSICPGRYWSFTEHRVCSPNMHNVRFSDSNEDWNHMDNLRLSCRPVRLVACKAS